MKAFRGNVWKFMLDALKTLSFIYCGIFAIFSFYSRLQMIHALIRPPDSRDVSRSSSKKPQHPYYRRPGRGHNHDCCDACQEGGDLICCDKCPASFHLGCQYVLNRLSLSFIH